MNSREWRRKLQEIAEEFGAEVEQTGGNHLRVKHPSGWFTYQPLSPGDWRALKNARADMRRKAKGATP